MSDGQKKAPDVGGWRALEKNLQVFANIRHILTTRISVFFLIPAFLVMQFTEVNGKV